MANRNTTQATFQLMSHVIPPVTERKAIATVLVDFSKAFDTVEVEPLLNKLHRYGIRGGAYDFMRSYLCNRRQKVRVRMTLSGEIDMKNAITQDSSLGPLLYIIYTNDMCKIFKYCSPTLYADDLD